MTTRNDLGIILSAYIYVCLDLSVDTGGTPLSTGTLLTVCLSSDVLLNSFFIYEWLR